MSRGLQKSIAQKKADGTYNVTRDGEREKAELAIASVGAFFPPGTELKPPKSLRTRAGRREWREVTGQCIKLGMLSPVDLPQVERLCLYSEELARLAPLLQEADPQEDEYSRLQQLYLKAAKAYDELAGKYYISPQARSRLALDALNVTKAAQDVRAADDGIGQLLARREKNARRARTENLLMEGGVAKSRGGQDVKR